MKEKVMEKFAAGYRVVFSSYYGESVAETVEDIEWGFEDLDDEWISAKVEIDEVEKTVIVWEEDDE